MATKKQKDDVNRVTPREVEPDRRKSGGASPPKRSGGNEQSTGRLRGTDETVEADGGDQAGVAGGSIDRKVSGRGGDRR